MRNQRSAHSRRGITLVEVLLGITILGILVVTGLTSLFYPRHSVVANAHRRMALYAGMDNLENLFAADYVTIADGDQTIPNHSATFDINGQTVTTAVYTVELRDEIMSGGDTFDYMVIRTEVNYPGGEDPIILETYRSPLR